MGWLGLRQTPQTVSPSLTLPPPAPLLLRVRSLGISKQGPSSLASFHSSVVKQQLLPKMQTLALHLPVCTTGSSLGHPWGSTHGHHLSATLAGCLESRCPFCVVLYLLCLICAFILSPGRQRMALLSNADATAGCHCLHFKRRKAWGDRKAKISATSHEELGFCCYCFCLFFFCICISVLP